MAIKETGNKWITDTISEEDLRMAGIIAHLSLVEIIIGTFNQIDIVTRSWLAPVRGFWKMVSKAFISVFNLINCMKADLSILVGSILLSRIITSRMSQKDGDLMKLGGYNTFTALVTGVLGLTAVLNNDIKCLEVSFVHVVVSEPIMIHVMHLNSSSSIISVHDRMHIFICWFSDIVFNTLLHTQNSCFMAYAQHRRLWK